MVMVVTELQVTQLVAVPAVAVMEVAQQVVMVPVELSG